tara:strand:+ start:4648 stop:4899 length:252 start_codon:yes stop_codon:yes gene_type:complete
VLANNQRPYLNMIKYKVEVGFHNASIGRKHKGDIVEYSDEALQLWKEGYLKEYKTKVVDFKPEKTKKQIKKKVAKKRNYKKAK